MMTDVCSVRCDAAMRCEVIQCVAMPLRVRLPRPRPQLRRCVVLVVVVAVGVVRRALGAEF